MQELLKGADLYNERNSMKCKAGSGREREREREGGEHRENGTAQKQKAVYFKVIDAIFFMTSFLIQSAGP